MDLPSFADLDRRGLAVGLQRTGMAKELGMPLSTYYRWLEGANDKPALRFLAFQKLIEDAEAEQVDQPS